jgi:hypothetical protein
MRFFSWSGGVIKAARDRADSLTVGTAMAVVAFCSGFISYTHICALTLQEGQSWKTAHLMPFCVDGQLVIGSSYFMYGETWKSKTAGLVLGVVPGIGESLIANWESGIVHGLLAAGWATVPAQAFACSTILFERWLHRRRADQATREQQVVPAVQAAPPAPEEHAAPVPPAAAEAGDHDYAVPFVHVTAAPEQAPWGLAPVTAKTPGPEQRPEPALAGTSFPAVPVVGPASTWPRPAAKPRTVRTVSAVPNGSLPAGSELVRAVETMSLRQLSATYGITKYAAEGLKAQLKAGTLGQEENQEVVSDAA